MERDPREDATGEAQLAKKMRVFNEGQQQRQGAVDDDGTAEAPFTARDARHGRASQVQEGHDFNNRAFTPHPPEDISTQEEVRFGTEENPCGYDRSDTIAMINCGVVSRRETDPPMLSTKEILQLTAPRTRDEFLRHTYTRNPAAAFRRDQDRSRLLLSSQQQEKPNEFNNRMFRSQPPEGSSTQEEINFSIRGNPVGYDLSDTDVMMNSRDISRRETAPPILSEKEILQLTAPRTRDTFERQPRAGKPAAGLRRDQDRTHLLLLQQQQQNPRVGYESNLYEEQQQHRKRIGEKEQECTEEEQSSSQLREHKNNIRNGETETSYVFHETKIHGPGAFSIPGINREESDSDDDIRGLPSSASDWNEKNDDETEITFVPEAHVVNEEHERRKSTRLREMENEILNLRKEAEKRMNASIATSVVVLPLFSEQNPGSSENMTVDEEKAVQDGIGQDQKEQQEKTDERDKKARHFPSTVSFYIYAIIFSVAIIGITIGMVSYFVVPGSGDDLNGNDDNSISPKLESIKQKSFLTCAVVGADKTDQQGNAGLMADFCRAITAAIFGQAHDHYKFQEAYGGASDFKQLRDGQVDVLLVGRTLTMERQVFEDSSGVGYAFTSPYYYDGMHYGGIPEYVECAENISLMRNFSEMNDGSCDELIICVGIDTTHEFYVEQLLQGNVKLIRTNDRLDSFESFNEQKCNVIAHESLVLADFNASGPYEIGANSFSKEPLGIVTTHDDPVWNDFVEYVLQGLLVAEASGIGQANAIDIGRTPSSYFGVDHDTMWIDAIDEVGNYAEMFNRNFASIMKRTQINTINTGNSGLLYSYPFGDEWETGPGPKKGGTLEHVTNRGYLRCGIIRRSIFAYKNNTESSVEVEDEDWHGYDVDFCKAVSAAVFDGDPDNIEYYVADLSADLFVALSNRHIDLISGSTPATLEVDIKEPTTGAGFSLTPPIFYHGLLYGGFERFVNCAVQNDFESTGCLDLVICVKEGTHHANQVLEIFPENVVRMLSAENGDSLEKGMVNGVCNTVAGDVSDVLFVGTYNAGEYKLGSSRSTGFPYALLTRQDDAQWSMFCKWIVLAMYYADEKGMDPNTAHEEELLPLVELFGHQFNTMFRDAVGAVGSIGDIYQRHIGMKIVPRVATRNDLNMMPYGPQHFPRL